MNLQWMVSLVTETASLMATLLTSNLLLLVAFRNSKMGAFGMTILSGTLTSSMVMSWAVGMILWSGINPLAIYWQLINN